MKQLSVICLVVMGLARVAAAQAPGQIEPVTAAFLEKRIPEELAVEGVVLSRRNLGLHVEQLGDRWLVSLADLTTGRIAASTKLDVLPADREAAVAAMTHVVAELATQVVSHEAPPPAPPPPAPGLIDDRAERAAHEVAELKYRRESIHFGRTYQLVSSGNAVSLVGHWEIYQGDLDQVLEPADFYNEVGRPDLARSYRTRRGVGLGGMIAGTAVVAVGIGLLATRASSDCPVDNNFDSCLANKDQNLKVGTAVSIGGMAIATVGMLFYYYFPQPVSENEAKQLADGYNQRLRGQLGLPVVGQRPPLIQQLAVAPFATGSGAGFSLTGRF